MRLVSFIYFVSLVYIIFCICKKDKYNDTGVKGICYFDIDGTLTTSQQDQNDLVKQCLDNNFAVGIVTASGRTIDHICDGNKPIVPWMPSKICEQFNKNNGKMYNSLRVLAGTSLYKEIPKDYPVNSSPGYIKGYSMTYGRDKFYPNVPDKCVVLFDDQPSFLEGVKKFNPKLETQCANTDCGLKGPLSSKIVLNKIRKMQSNGCI